MAEGEVEPSEEQALEELRQALDLGEVRGMRRRARALLATPLSPEAEAEVRELLRRTGLEPLTAAVLVAMVVAVMVISAALSLRR